ncbi:unnamed protein product [Adineta steineri]|uniref:Uncharacterized protein n=2 Tax=Adineta steineri TaxID=433720 RepID=A0A814RK35_9BILA|nr:unnamed protein product [Adineta steineri]
MSNNSTREMEEGIYRMSFVESLLVLVVIGLWLLAIISLARKLERICNPPSIFPNYSLHTKVSVCPSSRRDRHSNDSVQSTLPAPVSFIRATSEPNIDASPRATIYVRSPSETCLHVKSTSTLRMSALSQHLNSPSALELGENRRNRSVGSLALPSTSSYRIHVETPQKTLAPQTLLDPNRIPSIVRRSLLDLHRRTLYSNPTTNVSPIRCIVTAAGNNSNGNGSVTTITTTAVKLPLLNRNRKANEADEDDWYRGKFIIRVTIVFRKASNRYCLYVKETSCMPTI